MDRLAIITRCRLYTAKLASTAEKPALQLLTALIQVLLLTAAAKLRGPLPSWLPSWCNMALCVYVHTRVCVCVCVFVCVCVRVCVCVCVSVCVCVWKCERNCEFVSCTGLARVVYMTVYTTVYMTDRVYDHVCDRVFDGIPGNKLLCAVLRKWNSSCALFWGNEIAPVRCLEEMKAWAS